MFLFFATKESYCDLPEQLGNELRLSCRQMNLQLVDGFYIFSKLLYAIKLKYTQLIWSDFEEEEVEQSVPSWLEPKSLSLAG